MTETEDRYVVVTTVTRGVFFGVLASKDAGTVILKEAQMAVFWPCENHSVMGLASDGPKKGAKISPVVPKMELPGVTSIIDCTGRAIVEWRKELWA